MDSGEGGMNPKTVVEVMRNLFAPWFSGSSWNAWEAFLKALFAIPMSEAEKSYFSIHTQRERPPQAIKEAWVICGRRGGKSIIASLIAVYLAFFVDHRLKIGEKGTG